MNLSFQNYFKGKKTQATDKKKMSNFLLDKKIIYLKANKTCWKDLLELLTLQSKDLLFFYVNWCILFAGMWTVFVEWEA